MRYQWELGAVQGGKEMMKFEMNSEDSRRSKEARKEESKNGNGVTRAKGRGNLKGNESIGLHSSS